MLSIEHKKLGKRSTELMKQENETSAELKEIKN